MGFLLKLFTSNPLSMLWIGGGIFVVGLAVGGGGAWTVQGWRLDAAKAKHELFITQVKAAGDAQEAASKLKDAENKTRMEAANAENARTKSALTIALNSLRHNRPGSSYVPTAAADAKRPELACYARPEFVGAIGSFIEAVRGIADEGTAATIDLNTAKTWAADRPR